MSSQKQQVADELASKVVDGDVIGLGSGSTAELAIRAIGKRIENEGIQVGGVPTSHRIALVAGELGIRVLSDIPKTKIAWAFDGADEVDPAGNMIKGRGAAMLMEKIIAKRADRFVVIVSEEKLVENLGTKFAVPVEVVPQAIQLVKDGLEHLGAAKIELRLAEKKYGPVVTEHGNLVLDATFPSISRDLEHQINQITGVVENGLFFDIADEILISGSSGLRLREKSGDSFSERSL